IQTLIVTQFNTSLLPALLESMTPLKNQLQTELSQKLTATDHLLKENLSKVVQSKTVLDTITNAVLQNLQMNMRECFKEYFRKSLPDYQKASHAMFKQLSETFDYIDEALGALDIQHSSTREHVPKVLLSTLTKLKSFSVAQPNHPAIKHVKKLERVIQGVLRDFE
ncbi:uncharacterized protein LOC108253672, partial [Diaphorina citri]|uniref:Uncharacterized protein LOC108253672 n=1 Tax=Diaphorina citri TaxID=121845 RepID=A0A1S4EMY7_DIACI